MAGLSAEARIATGPNVVVLTGGGDGARLAADLEATVLRGASAIISFGIAGGLAPGLAPGSCLVGRSVLTRSGERFETDRAWAQHLSVLVEGAPIVDFAGVDTPVIDAAGKRALHVATGAVAVDMESHIAARLAARYGLPFAALRVVADGASRGLPHAAQVGMKPDGGVAIGAVLMSLLRDPRQIPDLVRTALDARAAFSSLFRCRQMVAGSLGFGDFRELLIDVPGEDVLGRSLPV